MGDLLDLALAAHGGIDQWHELRTIQIVASITGALWFEKGRGDVLKNVIMTAETQRERLTTDFPGQNKRSVFDPARVEIERTDGNLIEARDNPKKSFKGQTRTTRWDDIHVAYFSSEALWTYLTIPFLYTYPGFETHEIEPIYEEEETWRRLKVTFPDTVSSHAREQVSCFGPDGLLRRQDYTVDVLGGATGLNYASRYREVGEIIFPTKRRVYAYEGDYRIVQEPLLIGINIEKVTIEKVTV